MKRYVHLPIFIQIINVLDLHFQVERFKSNTLACSYMKCAEVFIKWYTHEGLYQASQYQRVSGVETDYAYRQDMSRGVSLGWFSSEMQHIVFSPITSFVGVCVFVCVCVWVIYLLGTFYHQIPIGNGNPVIKMIFHVFAAYVTLW